MNGGLSGALISCNTVYVVIAAYFLFGERLNKVKLLAMLCLVTSVVLVSLFRPEIDTMENGT